MTAETARPFDNDFTLIPALLAGDASALEWLIANYHQRMLVVARGVIGEAFAEDVIQYAWLSAIKALPEFVCRSSLAPRLIQITTNGANPGYAVKTAMCLSMKADNSKMMTIVSTAKRAAPFNNE